MYLQKTLNSMRSKKRREKCHHYHLVDVSLGLILKHYDFFFLDLLCGLNCVSCHMVAASYKMYGEILYLYTIYVHLYNFRYPIFCSESFLHLSFMNSW